MTEPPELVLQDNRLSPRSAPAATTPSSPLAPDPPDGEVALGFWLSEDEVRVRIEGLRAAFPVILLGSAAAWIEPDPQLHYPFGERAPVWLLHDGREVGPLMASLTLQCVGMRGPLVGLLFPEVPEPARAGLAALLRKLRDDGLSQPAAAVLQDAAAGGAAVAREIIDDPRRIRRFMSVLVQRKGIVHRNGAPAPLCVLLDDVSGDGLKWRGREGWGDTDTIDIVGYNSVFRFSVRGEPARSGEAVSPMPARIERIRQRLDRRSAAGVELTVSYVHPRWPHLPPIRGEVVDVSFSGVRIAARADEHRLAAGLKVPLEIMDGDGEITRLRGEVRSVVAAEDASVQICGILVDAPSRDDERRWLRIVSRVLHATPDGGPVWREELWRLFESSGYFNLSGKSPEHFDAIKLPFLRMAKKAAEVPHLALNAACLSERGIEGNFSIMKIYEGTWMLHQLAKRPRGALNVSSRQVLRDIYSRCFEHAQADPDTRWIIAYAEAGVAWSDRCHFEFARRHAQTGLVLSLPFRLMEIGTSAAGAPGAPQDAAPAGLNQVELAAPAGPIEVDFASPAEQSLLSRHVAETRPRAYAEALDLVPERLGLTALSAAWQRAGLERERALLVAREDGAPVALAVVELGEMGTNLFRLLDSVRLFCLRPGGERALPLLVDAACTWFRRRGRESIVWFCEQGDATLLGRRPIRDLGAGRLWVLAAELIPAFIEHFYQLTAPKRPEG